MRGKCAFAECIFGDDDDIGVEECSTCTNAVHHVCSNALIEGNLHARACSRDCAEPLLAQQGGSRAGAKQDDGEGSDSESTRSEAAPKKKFYFTPAADLALLKQVLNIRPFAAEHGHKGERYKTVTANLNDNLNAKLSVRTVKDHFVLLISELTFTDGEYRKKAGVSEVYTEHKQLLQDISDLMKEVTAEKTARKGEKRAKTKRLETRGALFWKQARKRRCQRVSLASESDGDCGSSSEGRSDQGHDRARDTSDDAFVSPRSTTAALAAPSTTAASTQLSTVSAAISNYLEWQIERSKEEQLSVERELQFKQAKAEAEERRWKADFEFRKAQAESAASKWSEEVAIRREEMQLRKDELALLRRQMDFHARQTERGGNQSRLE